MATTEPKALERDPANGAVRDSFLTSAYRVLAAGERLLWDEAQLVRLDSREKISDAATRVGLGLGALLFVFTGWLALLASVIVALDGVPLAWRLAGAAVVQLLIAIAMLVAARRSSGGASDAPRG
jgi:putative superfamily III holin-X